MRVASNTATSSMAQSSAVVLVTPRKVTTRSPPGWVTGTSIPGYTQSFSAPLAWSCEQLAGPVYVWSGSVGPPLLAPTNHSENRVSPPTSTSKPSGPFTVSDASSQSSMIIRSNRRV